MGEDWYVFALKEIDCRRRRLTPWQKSFVEKVRPRIVAGMYLAPEDERTLLVIQGKVTDVPRCLR